MSVFSVGSSPLVINGQPLTGGFSINFDMGLNPSDSAQKAYDYLSATHTNDINFLNQTISGTQGFINTALAPLNSTIASESGVINVLTQKVAQFNPQLPNYIDGLKEQATKFGEGLTSQANMFSNKMLDYTNTYSDTMARMGNSVIGDINFMNMNAQNNMLEMTRNLPQASSGGSYVCTAMLNADIMSLEEYGKLNYFKDHFMRSGEKNRRMLREYLKKAPKILEKLEESPDYKIMLAECKKLFIDDCLRDIEHGKNEEALETYKAMMHVLEKTAEA